MIYFILCTFIVSHSSNLFWYMIKKWSIARYFLVELILFSIGCYIRKGSGLVIKNVHSNTSIYIVSNLIAKFYGFDYRRHLRLYDNIFPEICQRISAQKFFLTLLTFIWRKWISIILTNVSNTCDNYNSRILRNNCVVVFNISFCTPGCASRLVVMMYF